MSTTRNRYSIPADNQEVRMAAAGELWAFGLRPRRFAAPTALARP
jgi:hypothetical protein